MDLVCPALQLALLIAMVNSKVIQSSLELEDHGTSVLI